MTDYLNARDEEYENELYHYGVKRRSGRFPWGSGKDAYQHEANFYKRVKEYKALGMAEKDIIRLMGLKNNGGGDMSTTDFRTYYRTAKDDVKSMQIAEAKSLVNQGYSKQYIANKLGLPNESSVRSLLNEGTSERMQLARQTVNILKSELETKEMIDVGAGAARSIGVSEAKFKEALTIMESEGYGRYGVGVSQVTNKGQQTTTEIITRPEIDLKYAYRNLDKIEPIGDIYSDNNGESFRKGFQYPSSLDSKRLEVLYAENGGLKKDGLIEIRRGVDDLYLGDGIRYAQVRIMVDGTHYIKGMAAYSDDLPDGVDVRFNSNKPMANGKLGALKPIKPDPSNPFGSLIKSNGQSYYTDENGEEKLSLINKRAEQGDWTSWADKIPSQFLAKQNLNLARRQISRTENDYMKEYEEIMSLTNPTVKRKLLGELANKLDANSVNLKAAALPRQKWHAILPMETLKDDEIYAPQYKDGEKVALVRYPHGGIYEIPILTVNNKNKEGDGRIGKTSIDAVGITPKVAERLSGADFDGDTVMLIPTHNGKIKISNREPLPGLVGFDPKTEYSTEGKTGVKLMLKTNVGKEMGTISNLIMDMTIKGAPLEEMERAVRHSMVVIDAEKHHLDYKQSEIDNGIKELHAKWQGHIDPDTGRYKEGAGTLITRAKSQSSIIKRQGQPHIDPETGELIYKNTTQAKWDRKTGQDKVDADGNPVLKTQASTKMADVKDAHELSTGHPMEELYADYANFQKALANQCRKDSLVQNAGRTERNQSAAATYKAEVEALDAQLRLAELNKPKERAAQRIANVTVKAQMDQEPGMSDEEVKKLKQRALTDARLVTGAKRNPIVIQPREWEAIQAGAISDSKLLSILNYTDMDSVRKLSTPKSKAGEMSDVKINRMKAMAANASAKYTIAEIAEAVGCSPSTVSKYLNQ